ncbi:MAG: DUF4116 domain-containing protein [Candidatus Yonathbacteria bacterium]|nr:DUF4116 domain-containing protein [Candidatus Yonathbacteria bacterium]
MSHEAFNPHNPEYKKVKDLPQEEQKNFADFEDGFVGEKAVEALDDSEKITIIASALVGRGITAVDVLHADALDIEKKRTEVLRTIREMKGHEIDEEFFHSLSPEIKGDRTVILEAINKYRPALSVASEELKNDQDFVLKAMMGNDGRNFYTLQYASEKLREDGDFMLRAMGLFENPLFVLDCATDKLRGDKQFFIKAVKIDPEALTYASHKVKNDIDVVLEAVKRDPKAFKYASGEIKDRVKKFLSK